MGIIFIPRTQGVSSIDKVTKQELASLNKGIFLTIFAYVCLCVYWFTSGVVIDSFMQTFDIIALLVLGFFCLCNFFYCLYFLTTYGWSKLSTLLLALVTVLTVALVFYVYNIERVETFNIAEVESVSAVVVSKDIEGSKGSFVLVSKGDNEALTYKGVLNFIEFENGDTVSSVSTGKLVVTYTDVFGHSKVRSYNGIRFDRG